MTEDGWAFIRKLQRRLETQEMAMSGLAREFARRNSQQAVVVPGSSRPQSMTYRLSGGNGVPGSGGGGGGVQLDVSDIIGHLVTNTNGAVIQADPFVGLVNQTPRHNGTKWVADSFVKNYGTYLGGGLVIGNPTTPEPSRGLQVWTTEAAIPGSGHILASYQSQVANNPVGLYFSNVNYASNMFLAGVSGHYYPNSIPGDTGIRAEGDYRVVLSGFISGLGVPYLIANNTGVLIANASATPQGRLDIRPNSASQIPLYIKLASSQSANALSVFSSSSALLFSVSGAGIVQPSGYKSSDGTAGVTVTDSGIVFKDGIRVGGTFAGGTPGGSNTQVQFNDSGAFGGDSGFTYNKTTDVATIGGVLVSGLTASLPVITDASKNLASMAYNTFAGNITSGIAASAISSGTLSSAMGGTGADLSGATAGRVPYFSSTGVMSALAVGTDGYVLTLASGLPTWAAGGGGSGSTLAVAQSGHGLAVQDVVIYSGGVYVKAKADSATNAEVVGIVSAVADANNFTLLTSGPITGLSGLTAGTVYFLDPSTSGALTSTEPTTVGQVSKPLLVAYSTTAGVFINYRGLVASASAANFVEITGTTQALTINTRFSSNNASLVVGTLPATASIGDYIDLYGKGAGGWKIAQNASQIIHATTDTTTGTGGSISSTARYDCVRLTCITANTDWVITYQKGTLTTV